MKVAPHLLWPMLILFLASCDKQITVKGVKAVKTKVETTITTVTSGTVEAQQQAILSFGISGRVGKIYVAPGDEVVLGQLIAELENTDLKIIFVEASKELKRTQEIFVKGLISLSALDSSKKTYEVARANYEKSLIRAPFKGMITDLNLEVGEFFQPPLTSDNPPVRMIDFKPRIIKGDIDEIDLGKVREGLPAEVKIISVRKEPFAAVVKRVVPFVNTERDQDRTSQIELTITENTPKNPISVGASADVEIIVESKEQTLAIPSQTILSKEGGHYVYIFDNEIIQQKTIKKGIGNYERTEVLSGLNEGEVVVLPPENVELKDQMKAKIEIMPWP